MSAALNPLARLSRWLDRRIDAWIEVRKPKLPHGHRALAESASTSMRDAATLAREGR